MFEGFVGCFSYLELFMKADNLRAVHVEATTVPDACSYQSKCGAWPPHCHQFLLRPMCGKYFPHIHVPSIYLNLPRALPWAGGFLAFQAVCRIHADNHNSQKQAFCNNVIM